MSWIEQLRMDLARYPRNAFLREQSVWAVALYRMGRALNAWPRGIARRIVETFYWVAFRVVETLTGCSFSKAVKIESGLRIHHFGGIFIHDDVQIGRNCTLRQGVTLGNRHAGGGVPLVGDDVEFGAYAQVLGREGEYGQVRMPSGEVRRVLLECRATIGQIGNTEHENITIGKAGRARWMGVRPTNRGVSMNPIDHPHGGGEGRTGEGRHAVDPWGNLTKGYRTRANKRTQVMIVSRRKK